MLGHATAPFKARLWLPAPSVKARSSEGPRRSHTACPLASPPLLRVIFLLHTVFFTLRYDSRTIRSTPSTVQFSGLGYIHKVVQSSLPSNSSVLWPSLAPLQPHGPFRREPRRVPASGPSHVFCLGCSSSSFPVAHSFRPLLKPRGLRKVFSDYPTTSRLKLYSAPTYCFLSPFLWVVLYLLSVSSTINSAWHIVGAH